MHTVHQYNQDHIEVHTGAKGNETTILENLLPFATITTGPRSQLFTRTFCWRPKTSSTSSTPKLETDACSAIRCTDIEAASTNMEMEEMDEKASFHWQYSYDSPLARARPSILPTTTDSNLIVEFEAGDTKEDPLSHDYIAFVPTYDTPHRDGRLAGSANRKSRPEVRTETETKEVKIASDRCILGDRCLEEKYQALLQQYPTCLASKAAETHATSSDTIPPSTTPPHGIDYIPTPPTNRYSLAILAGFRFRSVVMHDPRQNLRHYYLPLPPGSPTIEFRLVRPSLAERTELALCGEEYPVEEGVAVDDILHFDGMIIADGLDNAWDGWENMSPGTSINLTIDWKGYEEPKIVPILVKCYCGSDITKAQLAVAVSRAHQLYFWTQKIHKTYAAPLDGANADLCHRGYHIQRHHHSLRLMALHSPDNGITWRAQHAVVDYANCGVGALVKPAKEGILARLGLTLKSKKRSMGAMRYEIQRTMSSL